MKQLINILLLLQVMIYVACNDSDRIAPTGYLYLGVDSNTSIQTRSERPVSDEILRVDIITASGDTLRTYDNYLTDVKGEKIMLPVGTYTVAVSSADKNGSAWDEPYYHGSAETTIKDGETNQITVVCKVANTGVRVLYDNDGSGDNDLNDYLVDYYTEVSVGDNELTYVKDETRTGYFTTEGDLVAVFHATNLDGNKFALKRTISNVAPTTLYTLKYQLKNEGSSGADIDIEVDKDSTQVHCTIFIKEEDFISSAQPKLEITNMEEGNEVDWRPYRGGNFEPYPYDHPMLNIKIPAGIEPDYENTFKINVSSTSTRYTEADLKIDKDKVAAGEEVSIDLYDLLLSRFEEIPVEEIKEKETHTFNIYILDKLNQEVSLTFTFVINPDVAVETMSANAFSTFAFLQGASDDLQNACFKVWETNGGSEETATEIPAQGTTFTAVVTGLKPGTKYTYKAYAGEAKDAGAPVSFTTEGASVLPGGNMDEWGYEEADGYYDYPLGKLNDENETIVSPFWCSGNNNYMSMGTPELLNPIENGGGKAANLQSTKPKMLVKLAAGNMLTGDFKVDGLGGNITFNRKFYSRPTKFVGKYFYTPGNVDVPGTVKMPSGKEIVIGNNSSDKCSIYIAISKEPYSINTNDSKTLFDLEMPDFKNRIIAYGSISEEEEGASTGGWRDFEIKLKYLQPDEICETYYIVIVTSACKYGDYFYGSTSSNLKLDDLELLYDYDEDCFN